MSYMVSFVVKAMADWALVLAVPLGLYALLFKAPKGQRLSVYPRVLMAGLTAYLLAKFIGSIYQPSTGRPFELLGVVAGASFINNPGFPSDHCLFITALTLAVWFETRQKFISAILVGLTVATCVGRVLALVHTPMDVVGGVVIASMGSIWYFSDSTKIKNR